MAASMIDHMADGTPDEKNDHNTSEADRSNSSNSDSDYIPNECSSDSKDSVKLRPFSCFLKIF